jgi:methylmalonyl-CoA mutase
VIPNFQNIELNGVPAPDAGAWAENARAEAGRPIDQAVWPTPEGIDVRPHYDELDLDGLDHLETMPGLARGPYPTMYTKRPGRCVSMQASHG